MNFMLSLSIAVFSVKSAINLHTSSILMIHFSLTGLSNDLRAYYLPSLLSEMYPSLPLKELITAFGVSLFYFIFVILCNGRMISIILLLIFTVFFHLKYFYFIFI